MRRCVNGLTMFFFQKSKGKKQNKDDTDEIKKDIGDGAVSTWNRGLVNLVSNGNSKGDQACE